MSNIYEVFGVSSDLQLANIFNKLDLTPYELMDMETIISNSRLSMKKKREQILEMMSSSAVGNYEICENVFEKARLKMRRFVKENYGNSSQPLNMNQILELNKLFTLAAEKFQKVNCSQQFYDLLTQKTSKNIANAFFNTLKNISENAECKFDPELIIDGQNFAQAIYPSVNELMNFLNNCKAEKKEEVKESKKNTKKQLDESLEDTLNNFRYFITSSSNEKELNYIKDKLEILFNQANDTEIRNDVSELLSMINSKLNKEKSSVNECCELDNLLEPFKATVVNITVNDDGCLEDCEKEMATNNLKALASHINDKKDYCEENNIENMQTINSLLSSLASFFQKRLCESQDLDNNIIYDPNKELEDIKERYINKELDYYDAIKEVENIIGNEKISEEKVESWDDSSKHGLYGIRDNGKMEDAIESVNAQIDDFGSYDDEYIRNICDDVAKENGVDVKKLYYYVTNEKWSAWDKDEDYEELDEDTVYDHSWYEVKGQKYPKRTKEGVICESENDVLNDILRDLDKYLDDNNSINTETVCDVIEKNMRKNNIPDESFDDLFAEVNDKLVSHDIRMTDEKLNEMCSGGACCAGAVATIPSPSKPKSIKRKHKKSKVDEMALNMFKKQIIEDVNSQINSNGNHYEYKDGYFYINGNIARTKSKYQMLEALDDMIELETLPGFNSEEMKLFEDIEASGDIGNKNDNDQNDNSNNNNNDNNNNVSSNINQDNLGNVEQNVTQDNDLTPQQRQLKKDNEKVLDQSLNTGNETNVSVNQGLDNNNDTTNNPTPKTNNIKYKVIGKDDSDSNNIKYIIQDPNTKQTMVVDATKLRLEK